MLPSPSPRGELPRGDTPQPVRSPLNSNLQPADGVIKVIASPAVPLSPQNPQPATKVDTLSDLKKVRKVRFNPYVHKIRLPVDEAEEAQRARKSKIKEAPFHDELWDGEEDAFRERELTPDELWSLRLKSRVSSLPRKLKGPLKRGFRALASLLPGTQPPVDQVSAHAHRINDKDSGKDSDNEADSDFGMSKLPLMRRQSSSLRATELYSEEINSATFARFDELSRMIEELKTVPSDLAKSERDLTAYRKQLQEAKDELRRLRFEVPELERRLNRNANPRLLHYVQFSRDEKVKRLQQEYEDMIKQKENEQKRVEKLAMNIYEENERLDKFGTRLSQLRGAEAERSAIEKFVIQEAGKDNGTMCKLWDALDACKSKLERERADEKKLRKSAAQLRDVIIGQFLHNGQQALMEALELTKNIRTSKAASFSPSHARLSGSAPQMKTMKSTMSYLKNGSPSLSAHMSLDQLQSVQQNETLPATQRRKTLTKARENVSQAVELLESILDDLELNCKNMWSPSVLGWRRELTSMALPEFGGTLKKRSTSDFDAKKNMMGSLEDMSDIQAEMRIQKKLQIIHKLTELTNRYAEFIEREATRTSGRVKALEEERKKAAEQVHAYEQTVFQAIRSRFAPKTSDLSTEASINQQNKVREVKAASVSSSTTNPDDDLDENSSMIFPDADSPKMAASSNVGSPALASSSDQVMNRILDY